MKVAGSLAVAEIIADCYNGSMNKSGYFLRGINEDHILVFRSEDPEELLRIIQRLCASRDKGIRALAKQLEIDWYSQQNKFKEKDNKR